MKRFVREAGKALGYGAYRSLHLERLLARRGVASVLNLHRVHPEPSPYWPPMRPDDLDWLITRLRTVGAFVGIDEISAHPVPPRARLFALSFDDGYDDFTSHALPVIAAHGVPVNLNVVGSSLDRGKPIWNARLYAALGRNPAGVARAVHRLVPALGRDADSLPRAHFGARLSDHLRRSPEVEREALVDRFETELGLKGRSLGVVTPHEVSEFPDLVHVGSHSYAHESMGQASMEAFLADFDACRQVFRERLQRPLTTYAFPLGAYRREQVDALLAEGVERVLLVDERATRGGRPVIPRLTIGGTRRGQFLAKSTPVGPSSRPTDI